MFGVVAEDFGQGLPGGFVVEEVVVGAPGEEGEPGFQCQTVKSVAAVAVQEAEVGGVAVEVARGAAGAFEFNRDLFADDVFEFDVGIIAEQFEGENEVFGEGFTGVKPVDQQAGRRAVFLRR